MRGTPKKRVGWISRRFGGTVSIDSAKLTWVAARGVVPGGEEPLGDVAQRQVRQRQVVAVRAAGRERAARRSAPLIANSTLATESIAPLGGPVVPEV